MRVKSLRWIGLALALALTASCSQKQAEPAALPPPPLLSVAVQPAQRLRIDQIVVHKAARQMVLYVAGRPTYQIKDIQLGDAPQGHKQFQGDERTPEGRYTLDYRNPESAYHLSLHISYPNRADRAFAESHGQSPGGAIFIHGQPNALTHGRVPGDWTDGCIAVSNDEIEALWDAVADGTVIDILP